MSAEAVMLGMPLLFDETKESWKERALCAQTDPDAFFPDQGGSVAAAKRICKQCDVREECLEWALDAGEQFGVWGGLSERERRAVAKERQRKPSMSFGAPTDQEINRRRALYAAPLEDEE